MKKWLLSRTLNQCFGFFWMIVALAIVSMMVWGRIVQHEAIKNCRDHGGFATMGFSEIVCVKPEAILWSEQVSW